MDIIDSEEPFLLAIDDAMRRAEKIMDLSDCSDELDDECLEEIYQARHHCGTCIVRTVMETVWPEVEKYIDYLK